jgi:hypothetical protein
MPDLSHNLQPSSQLPALTPDLVAEGGGEVWRVLRLAPHLARLAGVNPDAVRGRRLEHLFSGAVPALPELAREAAERDESLTGIRVCLHGGEQGVLVAEEVKSVLPPGGCGSIWVLLHSSHVNINGRSYQSF